MPMRWLVLLAIVFGILSTPARAGDTPPEAFGEVNFEMPEGGAYAQEMITMVVRFYFKARATTEAMEQPDLADLGWTQLGRDVWAPTRIGNVNWFGVTRRIAIFAPEAKTYTIPPFTHHVTLIDGEDRRWKVDAVSKPVELSIRPWTGATDGPDDEDTWWLPARSVEIVDEWSIDPATLKAGETSRRRLQVTAVGTLAEQLPPTIDTQSPGLVIFPGPVERRTEIVEGMPVAQAIYTFDVRPHTGDPVILREVLLPWFDVAAREMRQAIVPGASIGEGMVVPGQPLSDPAESWSSAARIALTFGSGTLAFAGAVALLLAPGRRDREPVPHRLLKATARWRRLVPVYLADWSGRPEALRAAIYRLALEDGAEGRRWLADPAVAAALGEVDAALFGGRGDGTVPPAVAGRLTDRVVNARRRVFREIRKPDEPAMAADAFGR